MPPTCPHELRPGTTVCLHCRREARQAARARVGRAAAIVGGGAFAVATVVAMGVSIARSMRAPESSTDDGALVPAAIVAPDSTSSVSVALASPPPPPLPSPAPAAAARASRPADPPIIAPTIAAGRTELGGGVFATREGGTVRVSFDTPDTRTRRRDKFERVVRSTLPHVYGPGVDAMLAKIPVGELMPVGALPVDLVTRGVRVPAGGGWLLAIWPETRPGRDGPLVISYRATLTR